MTRTPPADFAIDERLVRLLLGQQHPDLAGESIRLLDNGWDNAMYRLGESLVVRLPRRREAVSLIEHEQTWLPVLAESLPIPIPAPVRVGRPSDAYPRPWSILPWIPGRSADLDPPQVGQSQPLAAFLRALHRAAPESAPRNSLRGVPLAERKESVDERLTRLQARDRGIVNRQLLAIWRRALAAPLAHKSCWLHGDLHARNVLVRSGVITGVIDWGDISSGDPATDLACIWSLFEDPAARAECLSFYGADQTLRTRAKGWAVLFGAALLETGLADHPSHAAMGRAMLRRLVDDE
jgi:aminoglycoside phosphotransferase (APT) family kinase protein